MDAFFLHTALVTTFADNFEILAAKTVEQVRKPLEQLRERVQANNKELVKRGENMEKKYATLCKNLDRSKLRCEQVCRQSQAARKVAAIASKNERERSLMLRDPRELQTYQQNAEKAKKKAKALTQEALTCDRQYMENVKSLRGYRSQYDVSMKSLLGQLENLEVERLETISSLLRHYMVIQESMVRSLHGNISKVSHEVRAMDPQEAVQAFISKHRTNRSPEPLPEYSMFEGHPMYVPPDEEKTPTACSTAPGSGATRDTSKRPSSQRQATLVQPANLAPESRSRSDSGGTDSSAGSFVVVDDPFGSLVHSKVPKSPTNVKRVNDPTVEQEQTILKYVQTIMYVKSEDRLEDAELLRLRNECTAFFKTARGRLSFAAVLNRQRNVNQGLQLTSIGIKALASLIWAFLDEAKQAMHVRPAQLVMIMSQTFFCNVEEGDGAEVIGVDGDNVDTLTGSSRHRVYLQHHIQPHSIWKELRFWEEAFFDSYTKEMSKFQQTQKWHSDAEQQEAVVRQKNILFGQLGAFAHNMKEFGMDSKSTRGMFFFFFFFFFFLVLVVVDGGCVSLIVFSSAPCV